MERLNDLKIGIIIQARTGSSRLPGKVMKYLPFGCTTTVLEQVIARVRESKTIHKIVIATTEKNEDDSIAAMASNCGIRCFRGSEDDVLSRYYNAAKDNALDVVVRITSDCPCIDPDIIDEVVNIFLADEVDYASNTLERTYPRGLDVEVFSFSALERAQHEGVVRYDREHVTPYIYKNPSIFSVKSITAPEDINYPEIRVTLDTYEDYMLLCAVYNSLYEEAKPVFKAKDLVGLFRDKPWLYMVNKEVLQKREYTNVADELAEASKLLRLNMMERAAKIIEEALTEC